MLNELIPLQGCVILKIICHFNNRTHKTKNRNRSLDPNLSKKKCSEKCISK